MSEKTEVLERVKQSDVLRAAIAALADANGGKITPDDVIEAARSPQSPLHGYFQWDVDKAAIAHWRATARHLIASVRYQITTKSTIVEVVAYVRNPDLPAHEQGYLDTQVLRNDKDASARAFVYELTRAEASMDRAAEVAKALNVQPDVKQLKRRSALLRESVSSQYLN